MPEKAPCPGSADASHMCWAGMALVSLGSRGHVIPLGLALDIPSNLDLETFATPCELAPRGGENTQRCYVAAPAAFQAMAVIHKSTPGLCKPVEVLALVPCLPCVHPEAFQACFLAENGPRLPRAIRKHGS